MDVRREVAAALGAAVADIEPLGGGCISAVYRLRLADGRRVVAKVDERGQAALPVEAHMLRYLAERTPLPVPVVHFASERLLIMAFVVGESAFGPGAERHAAELLAALHDITAPTYGFERDTLIGGLPQPNPPGEHWLDFFRDHRLGYMAAEANRAGRLPSAVRARVERLGGHLARWLSEPERPSLIHGDVWTTNVLALGDRITAFLDPALYFAHAEIELAFTTLFGAFGRAFYERYQALRPIAPGFFEERRDLYNLYPLLVHVRLFGGSYVAGVERILTRFGF
jgi:fructosamine-3-kinase